MIYTSDVQIQVLIFKTTNYVYFFLLDKLIAVKTLFNDKTYYTYYISFQ